jgi:sRNA-binding protein
MMGDVAEEQPAESSAPPDPPAVSRKAEHLRGCRTSREHVPALRERWPAAFPKDDRKVRPLANVVEPVAAAMSWTGSFTHGVLKGWKSSAAYCRAILRDPERVNLDGTPSGEMVDDEARRLATARLAEIKARREKRDEAKRAETVQQVPKPPPPRPPPPPPPAVEVLQTPEQIRAHLRASLLKRRA